MYTSKIIRKDDIIIEIEREKVFKNYKKSWKIHLINKHNPDWNDFTSK